MRILTPAGLVVLLLAAACGGSSDHYDAVIRQGTVYDGSGTPGGMTELD